MTEEDASRGASGAATQSVVEGHVDRRASERLVDATRPLHPLPSSTSTAPKLQLRFKIQIPIFPRDCVLRGQTEFVTLSLLSEILLKA